MIIGSDNYKYRWIEDWVKIPASDNGRTHGVVVSKEGNIIIFNQADPGVLIYDEKGNLLKSWGDFKGAHGMTLISEDGNEYLWLTDEFSTKVVKTTLDGEELLSIEKPDIHIYTNEKYSPTWAAVFEESKGGNGDIWIADGYGSSLIHRYKKSGDYISTITGEEAAGRFSCPHSLFFDYRKNEPELYVADRGNKRFQVFSPEGKYKRTFGSDTFECPCGGVIKDDLLYVPELCARIGIFDKNDKLINWLGQNEGTCDLPGWPNHDKEFIKEGKFNSPHHLAVDIKDNIYIVEWIVGGRVTKLERINTYL